MCNDGAYKRLKYSPSVFCLSVNSPNLLGWDGIYFGQKGQNAECALLVTQRCV